MKTLVVGTAGHIDHGKSALVKALTGTDPDRLKEEQARGITIDLGFAHAVMGDVQVAFVDVPGHERFVRNMLAGAGGVDAVLLVVAADESIKPQTREHFDICRLLGVEHGLIVLTKSDLVDSDTLELTELEARELVEGSFLASAPVVSVSAKTGAGLDDLRRELQRLAERPSVRGRRGVVRLPVDRVFSIKGFGTVATGTLGSGDVREGTELVALPGGRAVRVRGLQVHGRAAPHVSAPSRVAMNLGAIEVSELARGVTLASAGGLAVTRRLDVHLTLVPDAGPLSHGARVRVHHGTDEVLGRVALAAVRRSDEEPWTPVSVGERGVAVPRGGQAYARLRLERPAVYTRGDRAVIRAYSPTRTIGGVVVLDPEPAAPGIRRPSALDRFEALADPAGFVRRWLSEAGLRGVDAAELIRRGGLDSAQAADSLQALAASGAAAMIAARAIDAARVAGVTERIGREIGRFHEAQPLEPGIPREVLRELVAGGAAPELFDWLVQTLISQGVLTGTDRLALRSRAGALDPETVRAKEAIEHLIRAGGLAPPDAAALQAPAKVTPAVVEQMLRLLVREHRVVRMGALVFHADALATLRSDMQAMKGAVQTGAAATVDVGTFKARYGLSRKFAIPLLEWLDKERVTRRVGERRVIL